MMNGSGHAAGTRYKSNKKLQEKYPIEFLWVKVETVDCPADADKREKEELTFYEQKFGELPPLNRQG